MWFAYIILFGLLIATILYFKDKKEGLEQILNAKHISGIPFMAEKSTVNLYMYKDRISIEKKSYILFDKIKGSEIIYGSEIETISGSPLSRALVGGFILGGIGAIAGGLSGLQSSQVSKKGYYLIINYINKDNNEVNIVLFTGENHKGEIYKFYNRINNKVNYEPQYSKEIREL